MCVHLASSHGLLLVKTFGFSLFWGFFGTESQSTLGDLFYNEDSAFNDQAKLWMLFVK